MGPLGKEGVGGEEMGGRRSERGKEEGGGGGEDMRAWTNDEKLKNAFQNYNYSNFYFFLLPSLSSLVLC